MTRSAGSATIGLVQSRPTLPRQIPAKATAILANVIATPPIAAIVE